MIIAKVVTLQAGYRAEQEEVEELVEKLDAYSFITFWQRLLFLFTGRFN